jgi:hypothetical protein
MLPEEEPEDEGEVSEYEENFLNALKGLEAASKYIWQFYSKDNITVLSFKV